MKYLITLLFIFIPLLLFAEIHTVGSPFIVVGNDGTYYMQPRWSPDGSRIAFTSANYRGLWVISVNETEAVNLSRERAAGFGFEWSGDSRSIVTRVARFDGAKRLNAIKIFDIGTQTFRLLTEYRSKMPALPHWTDMDEKIYLFNRNELEFFESGVTAAGIQKQNTDKIIYYLKDDKIVVGNVDNQLFNMINVNEEWQILNPALSPDKSKIAFEVYGGNMYVIGIDGNGLVDLGQGNRPQWSPEGDHLVYMITTDDGHQMITSDLYIIKADGTEKVRLNFPDDKMEMNPSWAPDGKRIAFDVFEEGAIYIIEISK